MMAATFRKSAALVRLKPYEPMTRERQRAVAILENSEGCMAIPPGRLSQDLEPLTSWPSISTAARSMVDRMYRGHDAVR